MVVFGTENIILGCDLLPTTHKLFICNTATVLTHGLELRDELLLGPLLLLAPEGDAAGDDQLVVVGVRHVQVVHQHDVGVLQG